MVMHLPVALAAVSKAVEAILNQEFGRKALLIHNSIDCNRFYPGPLADLEPTKVLGPCDKQVSVAYPLCSGVWHTMCAFDSL
jgi:hypothetical protein